MIEYEESKKELVIPNGLGNIGNVEATAAYTEGFEDGKVAQKNLMIQLDVTENGTYHRSNGYNTVNVNVECVTCDLQTKTVELYSDSATVTPDSGYDGISELVVDASPFGNSRYNDGYDDGETAGRTAQAAEDLADMETATFTQNGTYRPAYGYSSVTVDVDGQVFYDEGYEDGETAGKAAQEAEDLAKLETTTLTENGSYTANYGYSEVTVDVDLQTPYDNGYSDGETAGKAEQAAEDLAKLETATITQNGSYTPTYGYSNVNVNVQPALQSKNVSLQTVTQTITTDSNYYGMSSVTVDALDLTVAAKAEQAAEDLAKLETTTITDNGTYTPSYGYSEVTVDVDLQTPYNNGYADGETAGKAAQAAEDLSKMETLTATVNDTYTPTYGYSSVTVNVDLQTPYNNGYADGQTAQAAEDLAKLETATLTTNGTHTPTYGYSEVTVDVDLQTPYNNGYSDGQTAQAATDLARLETATLTTNGTYTPSYGYSEVTVNVPNPQIVELTQAEYDALTTYDNNTFYAIIN